MIIDILKATWLLYIEMAPYIMFGLLFVALLNMFFTKELIIKHVGKDNFWSVFKAALFGVPLPLCSCGVIPSAVYMAKNGASKGSVVSFLISTPQTGIDSIIATWGILGPVFGIFRPFAAFVMGLFGGTFTRFLNVEKPEEKADRSSALGIENYSPKLEIKDRIKNTLRYAFIEFIDDISNQFIVGLFIGGLIAYFIPDGFFADIGISSGIPAMLLMVAIGIPMYVCATASIPIAVTLMMKGFSPGVAFVFLAAGPATNAASISILLKVLGKKVTFAFLATITISSIAFGLLLDWIYINFAIDPHSTMNHLHNHNEMSLGWFEITVIAIFSLLLASSLFRKFIYYIFIKKEKAMENSNAQKINIEGMTCNHCVMNVKKAIAGTPGVTESEVSLNDNAAYVKGAVSYDVLKKAIEDVGYKVV